MSPGPITLAALMDNKVQAADVFTTTPQIATDHLVALTDPKNNFAAQNVIPLVYKPGRHAPTVTERAERDLRPADHGWPAPAGHGGHHRQGPVRGGRRRWL